MLAAASLHQLRPGWLQQQCLSPIRLVNVINHSTHATTQRTRTKSCTKTLATTSTMNNSTKSSRIKAALDALDSQETLNYAGAARDYGVHSTTLMRRYCGRSVSKADATSKWKQNLNNVQEDTLLRYIDQLTNRYMPLTTQIIKNLAEEIIKGSTRPD